MDILFVLAMLLGALVIVLLIVGLFLGKSYAIERHVDINKPSEEVFTYLRHLRNQDNFSKWVRLDPAMKKKFSGVDGTVGFVYAWEGNSKAGAGEQEIKRIIDGQRLDVEVRFKRPFSGVAQTPFITEKLSQSRTRVRWSMHSQLRYPLNVMLLFMNMDKLLGEDMESSLSLLKTRLEN